MSGFLLTEQPHHDPDERYAAQIGDPSPQLSNHPLDAEDAVACLRQCEEWFDEAKDAQAQSRFERMRDHDYYDGYQYDEATLYTLLEREQAPLVFNLVKTVCDWVTGTERRTRIDWNVLPREDDDVRLARYKKDLLKYLSDVNKVPWHRSKAFDDCVISGLGWMEECLANDRLEEPLVARYQDWRSMWYDPYSRMPDLSDCRYIVRAKWLDLDYAIAMAPDREAQLRAAAHNIFDGDYESVEDESELPQVFGHLREMGRTHRSPVIARGTMSLRRRARQRVRVFETWFKKPEKRSLVYGPTTEFHNQPYSEANPDHASLRRDGLITVTDAVTDTMHVAIWIRGHLLAKQDSPYRHNRFPFTPFWAFREGRDGSPYGVIRQLRDPQDDYNKRRSKALFLLSTNQVIYEEGAIDEDDEANVLAEVAKPNGQIRVRRGALSEGRIQIRAGAELVSGQVQLMNEDKENIYEVSGVTRDNVGQESNAVSGKAILAKQQQGAVSTASLFDNLRLAHQLSGEKMLSNIEQFMSLPKQFRVIGRNGQIEMLKINQPQFDPLTGTVQFLNDVTKSAADFVVDQQDYRETMRMAMAEQVMETIGKLPGEVGLALLDVAIDLTDLPNKTELANRIRALNGQSAPGTEDTPEAQAAKAEADNARRAAQELEMRERAAKVGLTEAQTGKTVAQTRQIAVQGKRDALDTAGLMATALPLAPAADRLYDPTPPAPPAAPAEPTTIEA